MLDEPSSRRQHGDERIRSRSWYLEELPWPEAGRILARDPRLIFPVGALIQHGPHLPLGSNTTIVTAVAREVSHQCEVLLAPTLHFGVKSHGREKFAGAAGLQRKTLHRTVNELLAEWEDHGIREFFILTAHQYEPHLEALLMAMTSTATTTVVNLFTIDVGDLVTSPPLDEHGGELETSLMLHLAPSLVRLEQASDVAPPPDLHGPNLPASAPVSQGSSRGTRGFPSRASADKGAAIFRQYVKAISEILLPNNGGKLTTDD